MKTRLIVCAGLVGAAALLAGVQNDPGLVVHEWGTFTSVQGADGVQMFWNPLVAPDLPKFVHDRTGPAGVGGALVLGKTGMMTRQRMETPVIYFYSDRARTVDVAVRFPGGTVTEWYPQKSAVDLKTFAGIKSQRPALHWPSVEILPRADASTALPVEPAGSHYYAARETDASLLRTTDEGKKSEVEKFLFYRGVASFQAPLTVKLDSADSQRVALTNTGAEPLRSLFIYQVVPKGGSWIAMENLQPGETRTISVSAETGSDLASLPASLQRVLVAEGLYEREAAAMVKTWESSWFAERGLRVLYTLPRAWTDRALPLTVAPAPRATERVMIARAEIITPEMEQALLEKTERYVAASAGERPSIAAETRALGLGRFTESVMRRVMTGGERSREFSALSWELLQAATAPQKP